MADSLNVWKFHLNFGIFPELLLTDYCLQQREASESDDSVVRFTPIQLETSPLTKLIVDQKKTSSPCGSLYVFAASVMASLGGILFGYDIGMIFVEISTC